MITTTGAYAQTTQKSLSKSAEIQQGQVWWGYYNGDETLQGWGTEIETTDCGIFIPGDYATTNGCTINGIRFYLDFVKNIRNVKVWMTTSLPANGGSDFDIVEKDVPNFVGMTSGFNEVIFDKPYTITDKGVYVGYTFDVVDKETNVDQEPVVITKGGAVKNAFWLRGTISSPDWFDLSTSGYGNYSIQVLLSGGVASHNVVGLSKVGENVALAGKGNVLPVTITSKGSSVKSLDYDMNINGKTSSYHLDLDKPLTKLGEKRNLNVPYTSTNDLNVQNTIMSITKVNGMDNETAINKSDTFNIVNIKESAPRRSVVENYTGSWGGWCPSGLAGMKRLKKDFGDKIVVIGVHSGDMMEVGTYGPVVQDITSGFPSCNIDRAHITDPYSGDVNGNDDGTYTYNVDKIFKFMNELPSEAKVKLKADWADNTKTKINVSSTVNFMYDRADNPYKLAYVLLEDSVWGEGEEWIQCNRYPDYADEYPSADMDEFTDADYYLYDYKNFDVAQGIWDAYGMDGSLTGNIVNGKTFTHQYEVKGFECQNPNNLRMAVMVINSNNGRIVNADMVNLSSTDGIAETSAEDIHNASVKVAADGIHISSDANAKMKAEVFSADGRMISSQLFSGSTVISRSGLKGTYVIKISNNSNTITRKITI
jgi:hypothetical protein